MTIPTTISDLVSAQNNFDSAAYASLFTETAVVKDEGHTHTGKVAIQHWIEKANKKYQAKMTPLEYDAEQQVLKSELSGNFPGSPIVVNYQFNFTGKLISAMAIE